MFTRMFGIEVEFTGITRKQAADAAADYLGCTAVFSGGYYEAYEVKAPDGRVWRFMYDGSINCQRKSGRRTLHANSDYSVEMVSPVLLYRQDIGLLQELVRCLRKAGGFANRSCGIHIHLDGTAHTPRSIRNFINIIASRNDLFYKALQIAPERMQYCKKMDLWLVEQMNRAKPRTMKQIEDIWYAKYAGNRSGHYHNSRYHFLNLHSFFNGNHTVELRGFNGTLHAGKIRAYIVFALALNHQALTQKSARYHKVQEENERFAMRTYLNRIGFIGDEFKNCRKHLYQHLNGNAVATIERYSGHTVPVLVWRLQQKDELALDRYEGWPYLYRKQILRITQNGRRFYAMVYIMNEDNHPYGTPSDYYLGTIQRGYEYSGFDKSILQQAAIDSSRAVGMISNPQAEKR